MNESTEKSMSMENCSAAVAVISSCSKDLKLNYAATLVRVPPWKRNTFLSCHKVGDYKEQARRWKRLQHVARQNPPIPEPKPKSRRKPEIMLRDAINLGAAVLGLSMMAMNMAVGGKRAVYKTLKLSNISNVVGQRLIGNNVHEEESDDQPRVQISETISISEECELIKRISQGKHKPAGARGLKPVSISGAHRFSLDTSYCDCRSCVSHGRRVDFLAWANLSVQTVVTSYSISQLYEEFSDGENDEDQENGKEAA